MHNPTDRIVHTTAFVTPILDTRNLSVIIIVMYKNVFRVSLNKCVILVFVVFQRTACDWNLHFPLYWSFRSSDVCAKGMPRNPE